MAFPFRLLTVLDGRTAYGWYRGSFTTLSLCVCFSHMYTHTYNKPSHVLISMIAFGSNRIESIHTNTHFNPNSYSGNFDVLDDELTPQPVQARVENSEKVLWHSMEGDFEGTFEVPARDVVHRFCIENGKHLVSDGYDRTVGWALRVRPRPRALDEDEEGPDNERAMEMVDYASELQEEWETLLDHYGFLRTREVQHKILTDQILARVMRWTVLEGGLVALIALGQVLYLRKFMETRRFL